MVPAFGASYFEFIVVTVDTSHVLTSQKGSS
jgi:hypothetical protein